LIGPAWPTVGAVGAHGTVVALSARPAVVADAVVDGVVPAASQRAVVAAERAGEKRHRGRRRISCAAVGAVGTKGTETTFRARSAVVADAVVNRIVPAPSERAVVAAKLIRLIWQRRRR